MLHIGLYLFLFINFCIYTGKLHDYVEIRKPCYGFHPPDVTQLQKMESRNCVHG